MPSPSITISEATPDVANDLAAQIESRLLTSLRSTQAQAANASLVLAAKDNAEQLVGGLTASSSYGWLLIKTLWVEENHRRCGLGRRLMAHADQFAHKNDCHGVWLDTSSVEARLFYQSLGFEEFGRLKNLPGQLPSGHHRWFLRKFYTNR